MRVFLITLIGIDFQIMTNLKEPKNKRWKNINYIVPKNLEWAPQKIL